MKKLSFFFLLIGLASLFSCKRIDGPYGDITPTKTDLKVAFLATFDGVQIEKGRDFQYGNFPFRFERMTQYVSDLTLVKKNGEEVKLTEVEFLEFFPETSTGNLSVTPTYTFADVPTGEYKAVKFGFGVRPDLNAKRPSDFPAGHPLAREIEYWLGWKSYIFSKLEATVEMGGNFPNDYETFLNYHCGSAEGRDIYRSYTFPTTLKFDGTDDAATIELDVKKMFIGADGQLLDISKPKNQFTGTNPTDLDIAEYLMANWERAVTVK